MQHFHVGNRHQIKDAPPNPWATVHCRDVVAMSELARRGFHLVDMAARSGRCVARARRSISAQVRQ